MAWLSLLGNTTHKLFGQAHKSTVIGREDSQQESERKNHFQRLYDYYTGDEDAIQQYTKKTMMLKAFKSQTVAKMFLPYFNLVQRIINRVAIAYKTEPERYIIVSHTTTETDGRVEILENEAERKSADNYAELLETSDIQSKAKVWHRFAKCFDTVHIKPSWRNDRIEFDVFAPHQLTVIEQDEDFLQPKEVVYTIAAGETNETIYWSETEHWVLDESGKESAEKNPWNGKNEYGVLPFIPLRLREVDNYWGTGDTQLIDINEHINILLASSYYNAIFQAHGQAVSINMGLNGEVETGPDKIIQGENISQDGTAAPNFYFANPNPAIQACMEKINWMIKTAAMMRGLPAESVSLDVISQSGVAKSIDNWELLENREDDLGYLIPFERKLFDITRIIWNYHNPGKKIDENAVFAIDFPLPKAPLTEKEEYELKKIKLQFGLWTPVEDMIDESQGITEEIALGYLKKNLQIRNELQDAYGIIGNINLLGEGNAGEESSAGQMEEESGRGANDTETDL